MMSDYERTMELVEVANNAAGKSSQQFAKYQDTVEYKLKQLSNTWERIRTRLLSGEGYKDILDVFNDILEKINDFDLKDFGGLVLLFSTLGKNVGLNFMRGLSTTIQNSQSFLSNSVSSVLTRISNIYSQSGTTFGNTRIGQFFGLGYLGISEESIRESYIKPLQEARAELKPLKQEFKDVNKLLSRYKKLYRESLTAERRQTIQDKINALAAQRSTVTSKTQPLQQNIRQLTSQSMAAMAGQQSGQIYGQAFSAGVTAAITSSMMTDNPFEVFKTTMLTTVLSTLPLVTSLFTQMFMEIGAIGRAALASTGIGLIVVAIGAAIAGIAAGIKGITESYKKANELAAEQNNLFISAEKELKNLEKEQEKLNKTLDETNQKYDNIKTDLDNLTNLTKQYEELSGKAFLSSEEKEDFIKLQNDIAEQYPTLLSYYDSEGNAILNMARAWEIIAEKKEDYYKVAQEQSIAELEANAGNYLLAKTENVRQEDTRSKIEDSSFLKLLLRINNANEAGSDNTVKGENIDYILNNYETLLNPYSYTAKGLFKGLSNVEKIEVGDLLKIILESSGEQDFNVSNKTGTEIIDEIMKNLSKGNEELEQYYFNSLKDALQKGIDNLKIDTKPLVDAENQFIDSIQQFPQILLQEQKLFTDSDKNIQQLMLEGIKDVYQVSGDQVLTEFNKGLSSDIYKDGQIIDVAAYNDALTKYFQDYTEKAKNDFSTKYQELLNTFSPQTLNILEDFYKRVEEEELSTKEQIELLYQITNDENVHKYFVQSHKELIDTYNKQLQAMAALMNETAIQISEKGIITNKEGEQPGEYQNKLWDLSTAAQNQVFTMLKENANEKSIKNYIDLLNSNNYNKYNEILGQMDLTSGYSNLAINREKFVGMLQDEFDLTLKESADIINDYIKETSIIFSNQLFNEDSINLVKEQNIAQLKTFRENYEDLLEAQKEFAEKGELSPENFELLKEKGLNKYIEETGDGLTLLVDEFEQAWVDIAKQPITTLEIAKEANQRSLDDIQKQYNDLDLGMTSEQFDSFIKIFHETGYIPEHFSQQIKDVIKEIGSSYSSYKEYVDFLKDSIKTIDQEMSSTTIQSLSYIKAAVEASRTEVEDEIQDIKDDIEELNEDLADLQEQLVEDQEALNETEKELQEAIHGSDNFQSNLDGLVNYTEKINRLNESIENIKDSLEDVNSVDEAEGLLNQLSKDYFDKKTVIGAENIAIDEAIKNLQDTLTNNYGQYITFDEQGNPLIDFAYTTLDANDELRKAFEDEYNLYNEYRDKKNENVKKLQEIDKEQEEYRRQVLDNFVAEQDKLIKILKDKAKEEIDTTKEKYDALEEADNEYIEALEDAINKQRELRDQQNKYDDLAKKEKKLSLLQRDTSGANQKEVLSLQEEVEDDRQQLLDNEVDNLIESMKELYEKQKEARDAEIEYMETVTESTEKFADWAQEIMSTWQTAEDRASWYLENDPDAQDMTVEQTEQYLIELQDSYSNYVQYMALQATNFTTEQEELNQAINEMYSNTSTNVENIGTVTQQIAQDTANEIIEDATIARDDAKDKLEETQKEIEETKTKISEAEQQLAQSEARSIQIHGAAMEEMVRQSQSAMADVSTYATKTLLEWSNIDITDQEAVDKFLQENHFVRDGQITKNAYTALSEAGADLSNYSEAKVGNYRVSQSLAQTGQTVGYIGGSFNTREEAERYIEENKSKYQGITLSIDANGLDYIYGNFEGKEHGITWSDGTTNYYDTIEERDKAIESYKNINPSNPLDAKRKQDINKKTYHAFKTGGLVNYTGPAWVDGSPTKPEAFLNSKDTERIGLAAKVLSEIPFLNSTNSVNKDMSTNIGDTSIEIHINVDKISSDYDVDSLMSRMKKEIVDVAKPIGSSILLKK